MKRHLQILLLSVAATVIGCKTEMSPEAQLRERLQSIVIPEVIFRNVEIDDIVHSLEAMCMDYDPSGRNGEGIAILLDTQRIGFLPERRTLVSYCAHNVSALEVLEATTRAAGLLYRIGPAVVIDQARVQHGDAPNPQSPSAPVVGGR